MALYCSPDYQTNFESVGLLVQEKKLNIDFQELAAMIAILDIQSEQF